MFNSISSILGLEWRMASQLTGNLSGAGEELEEKQTVVLACDKLPLTPIAGQNVPRDVIQLIFSRLGPEDLFNVRRVSRLWHQIASTNLLPRLFPEAPLINAHVWGESVDLKKHELVFGTIQEGNITPQDYIEIKKMASEVEPNPRIYPIGFIDLPEGLTLNKLIAIGKTPKMGNKIPFTEYLNEMILKKYGDEPIKKTVRVLVTNGVFKNSRKESVPDQKKRVKSLKCDMPEVIPFMANIVLTFIGSDPDNPLRLFGDDPWTYTRCVEDVEGVKVLVGGFAPSGPSLHYDHFDFELSGVGGLRKFPGIGN